MVTRFGKFCRKLRIDRGEILYDMAGKLGVSPAFLSRVENGKKRPPEGWEEKLVSIYNLQSDEQHELHESLFEAKNSESINLRDYSDSDKEMMLAFARRVNKINRSAFEEFLKKEGLD